MRVLSYRVHFEHPAGADGDVFAVIAAIPEVIAAGADEAEALHEAELGLDAAIVHMLARGLPIPPAEQDGPIALASPLTAAKAFVIEAFRSSNLSASELGRRTGLDEKEIRRVLDPRHATRIGRMADVAAALGQRITVALAA
jgi:antitoxin HicB